MSGEAESMSWPPDRTPDGGFTFRHTPVESFDDFRQPFGFVIVTHIAAGLEPAKIMLNKHLAKDAVLIEVVKLSYCYHPDCNSNMS